MAIALLTGGRICMNGTGDLYPRGTVRHCTVLYRLLPKLCCGVHTAIDEQIMSRRSYARHHPFEEWI